MHYSPECCKVHWNTHDSSTLGQIVAGLSASRVLRPLGPLGTWGPLALRPLALNQTVPERYLGCGVLNLKMAPGALVTSGALELLDGCLQV